MAHNRSGSQTPIDLFALLWRLDMVFAEEVRDDVITVFSIICYFTKVS